MDCCHNINVNTGCCFDSIIPVITTTDANAIIYTLYILYAQYIITIAITFIRQSVSVMVINSLIVNKKV